MIFFCFYRMFCADKYFFFITFVVTMFQLEHNCTAMTISNKNRILRNILQMKSWLPSNDGTMNISSQKLFVDGQSMTFSTILHNTQPIINECSINKIVSAMYVALGCKCSESIRTLLQKTIESTVHQQCLDDLKVINTTVLKTISVLLHLIDIAPNVVSQDTGVLSTFMTLNLSLDELIRIMALDPFSKRNIDETFRRMIFQIINQIERFTISNCTLDECSAERRNYDVNERFVTKFSNYVNSVLDETGLSTQIILKHYNTSSQTNNIITFKIIIIRVVKSLNPILNIEKLLLNQIERTDNVEDIYSYMNLIFDSIMKIIYEFIQKTLMLFERFRNEGNKKKLTSKIDNLIDTNLITVYEDLILQSVLMKFPLVFVNNVKLVLSIIKDLAYYKNIFDLTIIKTTIDEKLNFVQNKKRPSSLSLLSKNNKTKFIFREFFKIIVSINEFKYFNLILSSQQNDYVEREFFDTDLNGMQNMYHYDNDGKLCNKMQSFYILCFDIESKIKNCKLKTKCLRDLKTEFSKMKMRFNAISSNDGNENVQTILELINKYLIYNTESNYADNNEEKLNRILRFVMNLIDKYQVNSCKQTLYRDSMYSLFKTDNDAIRKKYSNDNETIKFNVTSVSSKERNFNGKNITCETSNTLLVINNYINDNNSLSNLSQSLYHPKFYWRGELKTINEISNYIGENLLDFSSFTKFINFFHKWFVSILMYAIIDTLKCFSRKTYTMDDDSALVAYIKKLLSVHFPEPYLFIIRTINSVHGFYWPINVIGLQILLEDYLQETHVIIKRKPRPLDDKCMSTCMKHLDDIYYITTEMYNEKNIKPRVINKSKLNLKFENKSKSKANNSIIGTYVQIPSEVLCKKPLP